MKIGIFPACIGRNDAGPETYERELLAGLVRNPGGHEYHVFCFRQAGLKIAGWKSSFTRVKSNFSDRILFWPQTHTDIRRHTISPQRRPAKQSCLTGQAADAEIQTFFRCR